MLNKRMDAPEAARQAAPSAVAPAGRCASPPPQHTLDSGAAGTSGCSIAVQRTGTFQNLRSNGIRSHGSIEVCIVALKAFRAQCQAKWADSSPRSSGAPGPLKAQQTAAAPRAKRLKETAANDAKPPQAAASSQPARLAALLARIDQPNPAALAPARESFAADSLVLKAGAALAARLAPRLARNPAAALLPAAGEPLQRQVPRAGSCGARFSSSEDLGDSDDVCSSLEYMGAEDKGIDRSICTGGFYCPILIVRMTRRDWSHQAVALRCAIPSASHHCQCSSCCCRR